uniref:Nucleoporin Nup188 N-terminal domain-containing protein n=1 Tax=Glossina palpalis gambiensis TaxID=67801 RepID=A0A1B0B5M1_9MUSC
MMAHFIVFLSFDKVVTRMCHNPEYGPLLLAWMFVNIRYTNASENDQQLLLCRQMGKRALDLNCFSYMHDMISNSIFKEDSLVSPIVRKTVYNMLCCMCHYFDGDGSCCKYPYVYHLLNLVNYWHGPVWLKILVVQRDVESSKTYGELITTYWELTHVFIFAKKTHCINAFLSIKSS